jgi:hypothetical protein
MNQIKITIKESPYGNLTYAFYMSIILAIFIMILIPLVFFKETCIHQEFIKNFDGVGLGLEVPKSAFFIGQFTYLVCKSM